MQSDAPGSPNDGIAVRLRWPSGPATDEQPASGAVPPTADDTSRRAPSQDDPDEIAAPPAAAERAGSSSIPDDYRLADRVMERLGALREDVDANLALVRSELASLNQTVEDIGRVHALEGVVAELAEVRRLLDGSSALPAFAPLVDQISGLRAEVSGLHEEVSSLRRRISLRAGGGISDLSEAPSQQEDGPAAPSSRRARRART